MSSEEEIVIIAEDRKCKVPQAIQKCLEIKQRDYIQISNLNHLRIKKFLSRRKIKETYVIGDGDSGFPYLIAPVDSYNATENYFLYYKIS